ncbi:MAG: hypothetical protein KBF75_02280 [Saprospiraceae bacterium]|nr:hypothetical protein [Saprospiraceae bacterium]MCA0333326.1 hypothetical protein [Bacteroidota bacterium]HQU94556.1 hypothetical protein [Saprospiraceae bacterium]HQW94862.1 hypothetical protein [Saprospiraceae bacterium]
MRNLGSTFFGIPEKRDLPNIKILPKATGMIDALTNVIGYYIYPIVGQDPSLRSASWSMEQSLRSIVTSHKSIPHWSNPEFGFN